MLKGKIWITVFLISFLLIILPRMTVSAEELTKTIEAELPQDYIQCTFHVSFENDIHPTVYLVTPSGQEYSFIQNEESSELTYTLKNAKAGTYIVKVIQQIDTSDTNEISELPTANEVIGKVTVTVKAEDESKESITNHLKITKEIDGLKIYWKDDSIVAEWNDQTCGNVDITLINSKTLQIIKNATITDQYFECEINQNIEEILMRVIPSQSNGVAGAGDEFAFKVDNHPNGTVSIEPYEFTNNDVIPAVVTLNEPYSLLYTNNDKEVGSTEILEAGTYNIEIPTVIGKNNIKVYIVDEKGNMRSTEVSFIKDIEPPVLKISNDINGIQTYEDSITFSGVVTDFENLTFRNNGVFVDWDGTFEITASLKDGENDIILTAYDLAGNESTYTAKVTKLLIEEKKISWNTIFIIIGVVIILLLFILIKKFHFRMIKPAFPKKTDSTFKQNNTTDLICFSISILIFILLLQFVFQLAFVKSGSMEPTVATHEFIISNRLAYKVKEPNRGDIVTFTDTRTNQTLLKRIIGLPGDLITFVDGYVFVNDIICDESAYLKEDVETNCNSTFTVPENNYFVLGDNREDSFDSRFWTDPYIKKDNIMGKLLIHLDVSIFQ